MLFSKPAWNDPGNLGRGHMIKVVPAPAPGKMSASGWLWLRLRLQLPLRLRLRLHSPNQKHGPLTSVKSRFSTGTNARVHILGWVKNVEAKVERGLIVIFMLRFIAFTAMQKLFKKSNFLLGGKRFENFIFQFCDITTSDTTGD